MTREGAVALLSMKQSSTYSRGVPANAVNGG